MFKKNDTLRNVLLAMLACVALMFAGCNNGASTDATVENTSIEVINSGKAVSHDRAVDSIRQQKEGTTVQIVLDERFGGPDWATDGLRQMQELADAMRQNDKVMVELDFSKCWKNGQFGSEIKQSLADGSVAIVTTGTFDDWFAGLTNLKRISLPFTIGEIAPRAFASCKGLEEVLINFWFKADVAKTGYPACDYLYDDTYVLQTIGESAFYNCENFKGFALISDPDTHSNGIEEVELENGGIDYVRTESIFIEDPDYAFPTSITVIGERAFENCYKLTESSDGVLRFFNTRNNRGNAPVYPDPESTEADGTKPGYGAAKHPVESSADQDGYNVLSKDTTGWTRLQVLTSAFANCKALVSLDFTGKLGLDADIAGVGDGYIPATATITYNADGKNVVAPWAFNGCESLESIYINDRVTEYGAANRDVLENFGQITQFMAGCFQYTSLGDDIVHALLHTDGPAYAGDATDTAMVKDEVDWIGARAFFGNTSLESVMLPYSITVENNNLGNGAFANTNVRRIAIHPQDAFVEKFYSIDAGALEDDYNFTLPGMEDSPNAYLDGALITAEETPLNPEGTRILLEPTTIYAWYVCEGPLEGSLLRWKVDPTDPDLSQNPLWTGKFPNRAVLGGQLGDIRPDAFYKNTDLTAILLPYSLSSDIDLDPAKSYEVPGVGSYSFANCTNLEYIEFEGFTYTQPRTDAVDSAYNDPNNPVLAMRSWEDNTAAAPAPVPPTAIAIEMAEYGIPPSTGGVGQGAGAFVNIKAPFVTCVMYDDKVQAAYVQTTEYFKQY